MWRNPTQDCTFTFTKKQRIMNTLPLIKKELADEYETTKQFLAQYPDTLNEFSPHEKSMKMMPLATHVAEIFGWPDFMMKTTQLDFAAGDYQPVSLNTREELMGKLEEDYAKSKETLENMSEEDLEGRWQMRNRETLLADYSKYEGIRHALNQIAHHRAQLGVYYRLNNIPLPGSYGPSADSMEF